MIKQEAESHSTKGHVIKGLSALQHVIQVEICQVCSFLRLSWLHPITHPTPALCLRSIRQHPAPYHLFLPFRILRSCLLPPPPHSGVTPLITLPPSPPERTSLPDHGEAQRTAKNLLNCKNHLKGFRLPMSVSNIEHTRLAQDAGKSHSV